MLALYALKRAAWAAANEHTGFAGKAIHYALTPHFCMPMLDPKYQESSRRDHEADPGVERRGLTPP